MFLVVRNFTQSYDFTQSSDWAKLPDWLNHFIEPDHFLTCAVDMYELRNRKICHFLQNHCFRVCYEKILACGSKLLCTQM